MIKNIIKDENFLKIPATKLKKDELYIVTDLIDTLKFNRKTCVGMAANMIGYSKCAIVIAIGNQIIPMINPEIISKESPFNTMEECLSLDGMRPTVRYKKIKVKYLDLDFKVKVKVFTSFPAQIIQHEVDHLFGIII